MDATTLTLMVLAGLFPIVVSPIPMWIIRQKLEYGRPEGMFDWRTQSWAFLFGDSLFIPMSLMFSVYALRTNDTNLLTHWWWTPLALLVGLAASYGFRAMDAASYVKTGNADRLFCPSKIWHDRQVYISLAALLFGCGVPAILTFSTSGWLALVFFGGWVLAGVCDMIRGLDPARMHPRVQSTSWSAKTV